MFTAYPIWPLHCEQYNWMIPNEFRLECGWHAYFPHKIRGYGLKYWVDEDHPIEYTWRDELKSEDLS